MKLRIAFKVLCRAHGSNIRQGTVDRALKRWKRWARRLDRSIGAEGWANAGVCYELVTTYFKGNRKRTDTWFKLPNPGLGELAPIDLIKMGRAHKLLQFIENARYNDGGW